MRALRYGYLHTIKSDPETPQLLTKDLHLSGSNKNVKGVFS